MNRLCTLISTQKIDNMGLQCPVNIYSLQYFGMSSAAFLVFVYHAQLKKVIKFNHVYKGQNSKQGEEVEEEDKKRVSNSRATAELEKKGEHLLQMPGMRSPCNPRRPHKSR